MDESEFHDRLTRTDAIDEPEPIAEATLETLGETLSSGQADDIATYLPDRYAVTLTEAGEAAGDGEGGTGGDGAGETQRVSESERQSREPVSISREAFIERVRDRASEYAGGKTPDETDEIRPQITAVTDVLAETIPRDEQRGIRSQIPDEIESLFTDGEGVR